MTRSVIRSMAPNVLSPYELLTKVNRILKTDIKKGMFVSMWYGIMNIETGHLRYANAGHNPMIIYRADKNDIESYEVEGSPLGILAEKLFNKKLVEADLYLNVGDVVIEYTDGVTEAFNANQEMYDSPRLEKCIRDNAGKMIPDELITAINTDVVNFVQGFEQSDDILIIIAKRKS